jgi:formylglycine-generating enzyme required for sulfatase activity
MLNIFISYRRDDSPYETDRIYEKLVSVFERQHVFKDVDAIPLGANYREVIAREVNRCNVLLAVIGRNWLKCRDEHGNRRLDNDADFVRTEIQEALRQGKPVIPLLVRGARMPPKAKLPPELRELVDHHGTPVRPDPDFRHDMDRLIRGLRDLAEPAASPAQGIDAATMPRSPSLVASEPVAKVNTELPHEIATSIGMQLVLIPAGEFLMGTPDSDKYAYDWEKPQHRVRITKPFYLGKYPVTQEQWEAVMGNNPSHFKGPKNPVEQVSWDDCQKFLEKLNKREGNPVGTFQLPSEEQWEYACRAGNTTRYCCGDDESGLGEYAWYEANSGYATHPVGGKKPNAWGLYDMHGNVWEWCRDWWNDGYYKESPTDDPSGPTEGSHRVRRGGSWSHPARFCRSALRNYFELGHRYYFLGLRASLVPADK